MIIDGFKRILLPIDFSEHCDRAAAYAAWFSRACQSTLHLVHVVANPADPLYEPLEVAYWDMVQHSEEKARTMLKATATRCLPAGCSPLLKVLQGDPYEKLMEAIKEIEPDLLVMSTHGRSGLAHLIIGNVAEKMVRHAPCPVFIVRRSG